MIHSKYEKLHSTKIEEYGLEATIYRHKKSGASIVSVIAPQDENKVFGITFRTPPEDSTGIPHILEHSVLCGSRKYPVKEPFVVSKLIHYFILYHSNMGLSTEKITMMSTKLMHTLHFA